MQESIQKLRSLSPASRTLLGLGSGPRKSTQLQQESTQEPQGSTPVSLPESTQEPWEYTGKSPRSSGRAPPKAPGASALPPGPFLGWRPVTIICTTQCTTLHYTVVFCTTNYEFAI